AVFCAVCGAKVSGVPETAAAAGEAAPPAPEEPAPAAAGEAAPPAPEEPAPAAAGEAAPPLEETHACPKCGAGIADKDVVFCAACGTKVRE
ncbi:MAG: zinc ribbon domain-containing protein, partial [Actinomycetota bacterium]